MTKKCKKEFKKLLSEIGYDNYDISQISSNSKLSLDEDSGVFIGGLNQFKVNQYSGVREGEDGNILVIGGSGSGKSSGIVMPTLRTWQGALCATDIKGELSQRYDDLYQWGLVTRPYIIFDPMDADTPSYDPLWWLLEDDEANLLSNIWEIVLAIIPTVPSDNQPFWIETERGVFAAALLHYFNLGLSFSEAVCQIEGIAVSSLCEELRRSENIQVKLLLGQAADMKEETLAVVDRGLRNKLMLFAADPYISHAFRGTREGAECFNWNDLENYNVFLRIPANRIEQWSGAINLMYSQLIRHLERRPEQHSVEGRNNTQTLLLMDEFARFGKLEMITAAMSTLRSKNVNICLTVQSVAQLDKIYGEHDRRIIFDNCQFQAIMRANDAGTQRYLCELIGTHTRVQRSASEHVDECWDTSGYSRQVSETRDWIVQPCELSTLEDILLLTPYGFCRVEKFCPSDKMAYQMLFSISNIHSALTNGGKLSLASIDDPILFFEDNFKMNEGGKMLTIDQRTENAAKCAAATKHQQRMEKRKISEEQKKMTQRRNYIIGELVSKYFPEVKTFEPGTKAENAERFQPLEAFLTELAADQKLIEEIKARARFKSDRTKCLGQLDLLSDPMQCVSGHEANRV